MSRAEQLDEFNEALRQAQDAENTAQYFKAAIYYRSVVECARRLEDSSALHRYLSKVVELNKKAKGEFKEVNVETAISDEAIERVIEPILEGSLDMVLHAIGINHNLCPMMQQVEESARNTMPIFHEICGMSVISTDGHIVKGGHDGDFSWKMKMYGINQGIISGVYLSRVFEGLSEKGFSKESLITYLQSKCTFPESNLVVVSVGIERYFAGDYISMLHILIPQLENIFLIMSEKMGIDVIALNGGTDISTRLYILSIVHLSHEAFQSKWGRDLCEQLKFVLYEPLGYMLRHRVAHGLITVGECTRETANLILYFYLVLAARVKING